MYVVDINLILIYSSKSVYYGEFYWQTPALSSCIIILLQGFR